MRLAGITLALGAVLGACAQPPASSPPSPAPAAQPSIAGRWEYRGLPRGPTVSLDLWTTRADSLGGKVVSWMSGDMGTPPEKFGPIRGQLRPHGEVDLVIPLAAPLDPLVVLGVWSGDSIQLRAPAGEAAPSTFSRPPLGAFVRRTATSP